MKKMTAFSNKDNEITYRHVFNHGTFTVYGEKDDIVAELSMTEFAPYKNVYQLDTINVPDALFDTDVRERLIKEMISFCNENHINVLAVIEFSAELLPLGFVKTKNFSTIAYIADSSIDMSNAIAEMTYGFDEDGGILHGREKLQISSITIRRIS